MAFFHRARNSSLSRFTGCFFGVTAPRPLSAEHNKERKEILRDPHNINLNSIFTEGVLMSQGNIIITYPGKEMSDSRRHVILRLIQKCNCLIQEEKKVDKITP
jgi:hypothetical protein